MSTLPRVLVPMNNLPEWAYSYSEWQTIKQQTIEIQDGIRMMYDNERYKREKEMEGMNRLGLL